MSAHIVVVGSLNQDLVTHVTHLPRPGETVHGHSLQAFLGGKGANQAVAAARLGAQVDMIGRVGTDAAADALCRGLEAAGVSVGGVQRTPGLSGTAVITTTPDGENAIIVIGGANEQLDVEDIERFRHVILSADVVMVQLEVPMQTVAHTAALCAEHHLCLVLDPAPAQPLAPDLLAHVTWLTPNESEAASLCGGEVHGLAEQAIAQRLLAMGPRNVLLKQGARGCFLQGADVSPTRIAAFPVEAVDTTAAGDAFNGSFASALASGRTPMQAAQYANAAAALSVTRHGAQSSMPTQAEMNNFLRVRNVSSQ